MKRAKKLGFGKDHFQKIQKEEKVPQIIPNELYGFMEETE